MKTKQIILQGCTYDELVADLTKAITLNVCENLKDKLPNHIPKDRNGDPEKPMLKNVAVQRLGWSRQTLNRAMKKFNVTLLTPSNVEFLRQNYRLNMR